MNKAKTTRKNRSAANDRERYECGVIFLIAESHGIIILFASHFFIPWTHIRAHVYVRDCVCTNDSHYI